MAVVPLQLATTVTVDVGMKVHVERWHMKPAGQQPAAVSDACRDPNHPKLLPPSTDAVVMHAVESPEGQKNAGE